MQDKVTELIFNRDEITWQSILYELVRKENMDPWDINVSLIAQKYIDTIRKLKEADLRFSGKVLLAAAVLLRMKSNYLLTKDILNLDNLFAQAEQDDDSFDDILFDDENKKTADYSLIPRTPQPRKRKVSIYDLVDALQQALEVKKRRVMKDIPEINMLDPPVPKRDVSEIIKDVYLKIKALAFTKKKQRINFSELIPSNSKDDKIFTFIPLLHLTTARKTDLHQEQHFGEIEIELLMQSAETLKEIEKELEQKSEQKEPAMNQAI